MSGSELTCEAGVLRRTGLSVREHQRRTVDNFVELQMLWVIREPDASTRRTSGSEGGPGKRTDRDIDTAPRADPYHLKVRLEQSKVCLLVMIGLRADGTKELVALADGFRESLQSWADLLRSCRRRGMTAPVLAFGDGALGFWKALREVFPATREQRCWFHVSSNVLAPAEVGAPSCESRARRDRARCSTSTVATVCGADGLRGVVG